MRAQKYGGQDADSSFNNTLLMSVVLDQSRWDRQELFCLFAWERDIDMACHVSSCILIGTHMFGSEYRDDDVLCVSGASQSICAIFVSHACDLEVVVHRCCAC